MLKTEIKKVICSLTFLLFVVVMTGDYITQMLPMLEEPLSKPEPGQEYYGSVEVEDADVLMPAATESLLEEYLTGYYKAYPFMFYKEVHLKEADTEKVAEIICQLTGLSKEILDGFTEYQPGGYIKTMDENGNITGQYNEAILPDYEFNKSISYDTFRQLMEQVDEIIGGGSNYAAKNLVHNFSVVPMTYEAAVAEYEAITAGNHVGESYTRLFCDYMGIFLAVIAIFVAAFYWNMDRRAKVQEIVYSRRMGTGRLVLLRICALMLSMLPAIFIPYLHMMSRVNSLYNEVQIPWGTAVLQMLLWIMPEILFVTVLSALITEIISPFLSIFIQGAWWYMSMEMNELVGDIGKWNLILRHNTLGDIGVWNKEWTDFVWNRLFYFILSLMMIVAFIAVYDLKRKGRLEIGDKGVKRNHSKESVAGL